MTAVHRRNRNILYPPPTFQVVAGRLSCSTSPLAITSPGFSDAPIKADIVFLPDNRVCRKVTYRLYPTPTQEEGMWKRLRLHHSLYNGGLEERISAWRHPDNIRISFQDQCFSLTEIRAFDEGFASLNAQSEQVTLKRLDLAFQAFFRRVKAGETPGFPRFKSFRRFPGWGYKARGDGWDFVRGEKGGHGKLRIEDLGEIRCRGRARTPGEPVTMEIMRKADGWYASVTVKCEPHREALPDRTPMAFDWGVDTYLTMATPDAAGRFYDGDVLAAEISRIENPRTLAKLTDRIKRAQQAVSRCVKGSKGWRKAVRHLGLVKRHEACSRKDFVEKATAGLAVRHHTFITEQLDIVSMTASAKGTVEEPGKNVPQKAGLNRSILDTAPGFTLSRLRLKAEEAASAWIELNTRREAPSQHCPKCGHRGKKKLSDRVHQCEACGHAEPRDDASARYMLGRVYHLVEPQSKRSSRKRVAGNPAAGKRAHAPTCEPKPETSARAPFAWLE
jgi:putative transposase